MDRNDKGYMLRMWRKETLRAALSNNIWGVMRATTPFRYLSMDRQGELITEFVDKVFKSVSSETL